METGLNPEARSAKGTISSSRCLYRFEEYEVDCRQWQVRYQGQPLTVHRKSFDLLLYLLQHRERVVAKDELFEALWPDQFVEENNLSQQISALRKALAQGAAKSKVIETVPGRGYRFLPEVEVVSPLLPGGEAEITVLPDEPREQIVLTASESVTRITVGEDSEPGELGPRLLDGQPAQAEKSHRGLVPLLMGALAALVLAAGGSWLGWRHFQDHSSGPPLQVVLMPLQGSTGDKLLDRALSETLRGDLLESPFVSVVPSSLVTAAMQHMQRKETQPNDLPTAREVCERTNSQAVIQSTLARDGGHFLLTGEATGCVDGSTVSMISQEASRPEDLPGAIGRVTNTLRRRLGESRSSIARFNMRIADGDFGNTASLEALEAESEASRLNHAGKFSESILQEQRALSADPNFASAYYDIGVNYADLNDMPNARKALTRAYAMRGTGSPLFAMTVTARYQADVTGDLFAAERNALAWVGMYPRSLTAWNSLTQIEANLGKLPEQSSAAEHALSLRPEFSPLYYNMAEGQRSIGDVAGSRKTCERAIAAGLDDEPIHMSLVKLAFSTRDHGLYEAEQSWLAAHPRNPSLVQVNAEIAVAEGRFAEARRLAAQAREIELENGMTTAADASTKTIARELIGAGDQRVGTAMFRSVPLDPEDGADIWTLAVIGDPAKADQLLSQKLAHFPDDTLVNRWYGPMIHAQEDVAAHRLPEAAAVLEPTRPFDDRAYVAAIMRGDVQLAAGKPQQAEAEYRRTIAGSLNDAVSYTIPLAWLGLGRSLAAEGNRAGAQDAYRHFLALWEHADPDAVLLREAKQELVALH